MPRRIDRLPKGGTVHEDGSFTQGRGEAADTLALRDVLTDIIDEHSPLTVRALYYRASAIGAVPKTEAGYDKVQALSVKMRWDGSLAFDDLVDETRHLRAWKTYDNPSQAVHALSRKYARDLQEFSDTRIEIWSEKDALFSVIESVCMKYTVGIQPQKGYGSLTAIHEGAQRIIYADKPTKILYLGDNDPWGVDAQISAEKILNEMGADPEFERIGILPWQIEEWELETRRTKTHSKSGRPLNIPKCWKKDADGVWLPSCEVDAIPPNQLREFVEETLVENLGAENIAKAEAQEAKEKRELQAFADKWKEE